MPKGELPLNSLLLCLGWAPDPGAGLSYLLIVIFLVLGGWEGQKAMPDYKDWFTETLKVELFSIEE